MKPRKALLILICLIAALTLGACQVKPDPERTLMPTPTPTADLIIQGDPTAQPEVEIMVQGEPTATPEAQQVIEETFQPGGDDTPGLNG